MDEFLTPEEASAFEPTESELESEPCSECGQQPARTQEYMYVMSFLVFTRHSRYPAHLCRSCATRSALGEQLKSALLGWWGVPWGLMTFQALWVNSRALLRWSTLSAGVAVLAGLAGLALPFALGYYIYDTSREQARAEATGDWISEEVVAVGVRANERFKVGDFTSLVSAAVTFAPSSFEAPLTI